MSLFRRFRLTLLLVLGVLASFHAVASGEINLRQPNDSILTLDRPVQRLVTLSPHLTELVYTAGAGALLIATVEYSEYPAAAVHVPRIGDAFRLDIERIMALLPDLVIAWESGNPGPAVDQIRSLGIPVWSVEIRAPEEIPQVLESIGEATGHQKTAAREAQVFRNRLMALTERYSHDESLEFFYQVDVKPLFTINGDHLISKGLSLCGGHNIFEEEDGLAFQVSHEAVVVSDPDAMFAPWVEGGNDPLAKWRTWQGLQAVQHEALFLLPADEISRATFRILDSLELACNLLHGLREQKRND